jgi:predicted alpha/beta superfamily hydrolase
MKFLFPVLITAILVSVGTFLLMHLHFTGLLPWEVDSREGVIHATLQSDILQETREVIITLPQNYSAQKKYPVLYMLDAGPLQDRSADVLEILAASDYAPETIVVGIPNPGMEARQRDLTPPYMISDMDDPTSAPGGGDKFLEFIQKELIPFIDSQYATSNYRLFSGNSRGGLLVLHSLMTNPDLFQARICYSTPFWRQDELILQKFSDFMDKTDTLNTFLFFSAGEDETDNIKRGCGSLAERLGKNTPFGFEWGYQFTPKADHQSNSHRSAGKALGLWGKHALRQHDKLQSK